MIETFFLSRFCVVMLCCLCAVQDGRLERENLQAKVDLLTSCGSKVLQAGQMFDCVVFHDGSSWRYVCVCVCVWGGGGGGGGY